jgi:hypothetical protein
LINTTAGRARRGLWLAVPSAVLAAEGTAGAAHIGYLVSADEPPCLIDPPRLKTDDE